MSPILRLVFLTLPERFLFNLRPLIYRATTARILKSIDQQLLLIGVKLPPERGAV